jgi:hypothetical protein
MRRIGIVEYHSRRGEPVNAPRRIAPELLWVGKTLFPDALILSHGDPPLRTMAYLVNVVPGITDSRWTKVTIASRDRDSPGKNLLSGH